MRALVLTVALAGCAGDFGSPSNPDGGTSGDAPSNDATGACVVAITYQPTKPVAAPETVVRVVANVQNAPGMQSYTWNVLRGATPIPTDPAQPDNSEATFPASIAATYDVFLDVDVPGGLFCPQGHVQVEVKTAGANETELRVHIVPPTNEERPPLDTLVIVEGGPEDTLDDFVLDPGGPVNGFVRNNATPVASYLRFMPVSGKEAPVESFSDGTGAYSAILRSERHDVLVVPVSSSFAPRIIANWSPADSLLGVDGGTLITGVVRDPGNAVLPGAKVQLTIGGVPSTLATTDAGGVFNVRAVNIPGAVVKFDVTAPESRGLPRLLVSSSLFDVTLPITVRYGAQTTRDLAGTIVRRSLAPLAGAKVHVVGTMTTIGTVTTGAGAPLSANGEVRFTAITDGAGALPTMRAPAAVLSAVIEPSPGDVAVSALNLTTGVPAAIDAPSMQPISTKIHDQTSALIPGATLDALPIGALQLAGTSAIHATSVAGGNLTTSFAAGGQYDLRFMDPAGRGGLLKVPGVTSATIAQNHTLLPATKVSALVKGTSAIRGASVQILCSACTGLERSRPIAEGITGIDGRFSLAVPDP